MDEVFPDADSRQLSHFRMTSGLSSREMTVLGPFARYAGPSDPSSAPTTSTMSPSQMVISDSDASQVIGKWMPRVSANECRLW